MLFGLSCKSQEVKFSDSTAPVGDLSLTVPEEVVPIFDHWLRDAFVMYGPDSNYYMTGTTATPGRVFPNGAPHCWDHNDGIYLWKSPDMKNWESLGRVWSFENDAADWQKKGKPVKPGQKSVNDDPIEEIIRAAWAPEIHYIKSQKKWMIIACLNGGMGSFILESISGKPEGPYVNIKGNETKPIFKNIDASLFEDDNGDVYVIAHNHFFAKMKADLSDLAHPYKRFIEKPYNPEPYIEGVYMTKHNGKYQLLQTVWSVPQSDGSYKYEPTNKAPQYVYSYDVVVSESDKIEGPYSPRYPALLQGGHNNIFEGKDGKLWSTTFFNPRGIMGQKVPVTCRPGVVPVMWVNGKLRPDHDRAKEFYKDFEVQVDGK